MIYGRVVDTKTKKELLIISGWTAVPGRGDIIVVEGTDWEILRTEWAPRMVEAARGYSASARVTIVVQKAG